MDHKTIPYRIITQCITVIFIALASTATYACTKLQMVDFDYEIKATLGDGYSTFGRLWMLDGKESCIESAKYAACLTIVPNGQTAKLTVVITKNEGDSTTYNQSIKYNSSEVIRFDVVDMEAYLKLFVSNTVADLKMLGKTCDNGFPRLPRHVTIEELDNMFTG
jgi:hypothetical protein